MVHLTSINTTKVIQLRLEPYRPLTRKTNIPNNKQTSKKPTKSLQKKNTNININTNTTKTKTKAKQNKTNKQKQAKTNRHTKENNNKCNKTNNKEITNNQWQTNQSKNK